MSRKGVAMGEFEAIGDAVTGGIIGRAVEPKAGEAADGHTHEANCLNCGARACRPLLPRMRPARPRSPHLGGLLPRFPPRRASFRREDLAHLPLLAWKPGELTRRYIDGQRARFVSPVALFLFCVFLMFAVMGLAGPESTGKAAAKGREADRRRSKREDRALKSARNELQSRQGRQKR